MNFLPHTDKYTKFSLGRSPTSIFARVVRYFWLDAPFFYGILRCNFRASHAFLNGLLLDSFANGSPAIEPLALSVLKVSRYQVLRQPQSKRTAIKKKTKLLFIYVAPRKSHHFTAQNCTAPRADCKPESGRVRRHRRSAPDFDYASKPAFALCLSISVRLYY